MEFPKSKEEFRKALKQFGQNLTPYIIFNLALLVIVVISGAILFMVIEENSAADRVILWLLLPKLTIY